MKRIPAAKSNKKHVVFDIDCTITSQVKPESSGKIIIEVEGSKYFVYDGIEELVEKLLLKKEMNISFFSGGSRFRNRSILRQIKLSDGRSLEDIAYKILSNEDLTKVEGTLPSDKFSGCLKKDLSNDVMIDDNQFFVLGAEQEKHVLFLGKTFELIIDLTIQQVD